MIFNALPADPISFWRKLHPSPKTGFLFGCDAAHSDIFLSASEPIKTFRVAERRLPEFLTRLNTSLTGSSAAPRFVGFFGFEAGRSFDKGIARLPSQRDHLGCPAAVFGDFSAVVKLDLKAKKTALYWRGSRAGLARMKERIEALLPQSALPSSPLKGSRMDVAPLTRFSRMVKTAKDAIARGDIYQANLSLLFDGSFSGDPVALYDRLCKRNPSPYAGLFTFDGTWIVSSSPELLLEVKGRRVVTRPIAGTRPRGKSAAHDRRRQGQLLLSPKERAEHIMLVDLERNDLGRVCRAGSVRVTERAAVERYSHVMHIVSQVEGVLAKGKTAVHALKAVFPGGTITGCPKIKAIEIIQKIENEARGPFYGSAGFFCENGDAVFNILIRTAVVKNKKIFLRAGAGIVADSNPKREYREILAKARAIRETLRQ